MDSSSRALFEVRCTPASCHNSHHFTLQNLDDKYLTWSSRLLDETSLKTGLKFLTELAEILKEHYNDD